MMANQQVAVAQRWQGLLERPDVKSRFEAVLPRHVPYARFMRVLTTSIANDRKLSNAKPESLLQQAAELAKLGLVTDSQLGEAALIADNNGDVQRRVMCRGLMKLARQSGEVASIYAHEICTNDKIKVCLGTDKGLVHHPDLMDRGEPHAYYAVVKYKDGDHDFEIMSRAEVERIRDQKSDGYKAFKANKIKSSPWDSDFDEMAKKTVIRRLMKRVPQSSDLADVLAHEMRLDIAAEYREVPTTAVSQTALPPQTDDPMDNLVTQQTPIEDLKAVSTPTAAEPVKFDLPMEPPEVVVVDEETGEVTYEAKEAEEAKEVEAELEPELELEKQGLVEVWINNKESVKLGQGEAAVKLFSLINGATVIAQLNAMLEKNGPALESMSETTKTRVNRLIEKAHARFKKAEESK